jgi:hypothetical protein
MPRIPKKKRKTSASRGDEADEANEDDGDTLVLDISGNMDEFFQEKEQKKDGGNKKERDHVPKVRERLRDRLNKRSRPPTPSSATGATAARDGDIRKIDKTPV